jgi:hypothetical protein
MTTMTEPKVTEKKYLSGFCGMGHHEGTKPRSPSGKPMKVCIAWQICKCPCHETLNEMYKMSEIPREVHENPEYVSFERTWYMPVFGVDYGMDRDALAGDTLDDTGQQQRHGSGTPGHRTFDPTPSGRAARGQLEDQVLEVVTEWNIDPGTDLCTPTFVAWDIARFNQIEEPSTGAIGAVFDRWQEYGFAVIERKPVRFMGFTEEGEQRGLEYMKAKYKREKRMGK